MNCAAWSTKNLCDVPIVVRVFVRKLGSKPLGLQSFRRRLHFTSLHSTRRRLAFQPSLTLIPKCGFDTLNPHFGTSGFHALSYFCGGIGCVLRSLLTRIRFFRQLLSCDGGCFFYFSISSKSSHNLDNSERKS